MLRDTAAKKTGKQIIGLVIAKVKLTLTSLMLDRHSPVLSPVSLFPPQFSISISLGYNVQDDLLLIS